MNRRTTTSTGILLVAASALAAASAAQDAPARPVPAAAPLVISQVEVELTVPTQGLNEENAKRAEGALEALEVALYDCSGCRSTFEHAGTCPTCAAALQVHAHPILEVVMVEPEKSHVTLQSQEGMQVRLSDIERALGTASVKIDRDKMALTGNPVLVVAGVGSDEQEQAIQKALEESKLFDKVSVRSDDGKAFVEVTAGTKSSTRARVESVLKKVAPAHELVDVVWNSWSIERAGVGEGG